MGALSKLKIVDTRSVSFPLQSYFVASNGNDNNNGTTIDTPWQTLTKVNAATFTAGDSILFNKGDTFYGSLIINGLGTSIAPITFGAYGTGANPIITGFTSVTAWTDKGSNIWESTDAVSTLSTCNMVTIGGVNTAMGRYPTADQTNGGYLTIASAPSSTSLTCTSLTGTPDWTGSQLVIRSTDYTIDKRNITSQSTTTLNYDTALTTIVGYGFFFQNSPLTLTYQNAWYYDPTTKKIRIYSTTSPTNVQVSTIDTTILYNNRSDYHWTYADYIKFQNIDVAGANKYGFFGPLFLAPGHRLNGVNINNCNITHCGIDAVSLQSYTSLNINNNNISKINGIAINCSYSYNVNISNNIISYISQDPGMNAGFSAIIVGANDINNNILIEYNSITNVGCNAIGLGSDSSVIRFNYINTFCTIMDDAGGIYGMSNATVYNNLILNGIGAWKGTSSSSHLWAIGIYFDRNSTNCEAYNNSIANCSQFGILMNNPSYINVHNNTIYNAGQVLKINNISGYNPTANNSIHNNIFVAKTSIQYAMVIGSYDNTIPTFGAFDYNYYCRPLQEGYSIYTEGVARTLSTWQAFSGQDANSHTSPQSITSVNDFQFEYNATLTAKTVTLTEPMIDITGTKYVGSVTLQPFTSIVMMKDYNPA